MEDISHSPNIQFITFRAYQKQHLFQREILKRILVDQLNAGRVLKYFQLYGYVIMPNHIHFLIGLNNDFKVSAMVQQYKMATALLIKRQIQMERDQVFLTKICSDSQKQTYQVWEHDYLAKDCISPEFTWQKLEYIHNNPVQPHWVLAETPEDYIWSSARYYFEDQSESLIPITDIRDTLF